MVAKLGSGDFIYEVVMDWAKLPKGVPFREVLDVGVDSQDRVYVATRLSARYSSGSPMYVFDREGNFLSSWEEGPMKEIHGFAVGPDDSVYCADRVRHCVRKCTPDGKVLMTIGTPDQPAPVMSGHPFNKPTGVALDPRTGDIYVTDGYGNARVHKYSPEGKHLLSWGEIGIDPGQFEVPPHNILTDAEGRVYVADRDNFRVQVFDSKGKYLTQWHNMIRPACMDIDARRKVFYIAEMGPNNRFLDYKRYPNSAPCITIVSLDGKRIARFGDMFWCEEPHQFTAPDGIAVDSRGDLYIGDFVPPAHKDIIRDTPAEMYCLTKLIRQK